MSEWRLTTFAVPAEGGKFTRTYLWYRPNEQPRLELGLIYLWNPDVWRFVGNYMVATESDALPSVTAGFAFQDTFSERIAPYVTFAKHFYLDEVTFEPYVGLVDRADESHVHGISGLRISHGDVFVGLQHTGHELNAYLGAGFGDFVGSIWVGERQKYGVTFGYRF